MWATGFTVNQKYNKGYAAVWGTNYVVIPKVVYSPTEKPSLNIVKTETCYNLIIRAISKTQVESKWIPPVF
jgi:hypothetical protein